MSAEEWPIAAAMLQFPGTLRDGTRVTAASADVWERLLRSIVHAGFAQVEVPSAWLRLGDLTTARLQEFSDVLHGLRLEVPGISVVRESVIHPQHAARNLAFSHRTIDAAAALGVPVVCLGLHDALLPAQQEVLWFWTVAGPQEPTRPEVYAQAVSAYRELGKHAAEVGVEISLELYEDTYLGTAAGSVRLIQDIDEPVVGLNPDLGNLIRHQGQIEPWQVILDAALPYTNYWHVKNYMRLEDPSTRCALSAPVTMETGIINYRHAVAEALRLGYRGAFVVEHYGGDGLSVGASNRDYLKRILASALNEHTGPTE
jgi:sugar phosphate isomerase/epimerase